MTLSEFKAWFEGFTECMESAPSADQWKRIQVRVKEIDGIAVTKTVFVDRYLPPYRPYWTQNLDMFGVSVGTPLMSTCSADSFESHNAMLDLGKAEYTTACSSRSIS